MQAAVELRAICLESDKDETNICKYLVDSP